MKIVHISTYDILGGAARAAYRLHSGLKGQGYSSQMVVRKKQSSDPDVIGVTPLDTGQENERELFCYAAIQDRYINANRTKLSNTIFSLPYPGYDLSKLPEVIGADVLNLHWVAYYQSPFTITALLRLGKPVVWTLHDQWAFTGGCHYTAGCESYISDCSDCPQLASDPYSLPAGVLKDKIELFSGLSLTVVSPSRWLAECVKNSALFGRMRVAVIPNGVETDIFRPISKMRAKKLLGLPPDTMTVLFGAEYGSERRKGFKELAAAIGHCLSDPWFEAKAREDKVRILCFGQPDERIDSIKIPVISLGYLKSDQKVREAYNAADVFIQSSLEDNLPNTVLEAMSCGTPVIGFDVGGIPDMVQDGSEGRIIPAGDTVGMANAIIGLLSSPNLLVEMGQKSRSRTERFFSLGNQARNYSDLYLELRGEAKAFSKAGPQTKGKIRLKPGEPGKRFSPSVPLITQGGSDFSTVFDRVLLRTLKDLSPKLQRELDELNADRELRLDLINKQGKEIERLQAETDKWLKECDLLWAKVNTGEGERNRLASELEEVKGRLEVSEADRSERLEAIERQGKEIERLQAETDKWLKECDTLWERVNRGEGERNRVASELEEVKGRLEASEADRSARLEVILRQGKEIERLQAETDKWLKECDILWERVNRGEGERNRVASELEEVKGMLEVSEADRTDRLQVILKQGDEISRLQGENSALFASRNCFDAELAELKSRLDGSEADRSARLEVILKQGNEIAQLQGDLHHWLKQCEELWSRINVLQDEKGQTESELGNLERAKAGLEEEMRIIKESRGFRLMCRLGMVRGINNG